MSAAGAYVNLMMICPWKNMK